MDEHEQPTSATSRQDTNNNDDDKLAQLYQAAKDENELLEFKNYELMFKIQELELKQSKASSQTAQMSTDDDEWTDGSASEHHIATSASAKVSHSLERRAVLSQSR